MNIMEMLQFQSGKIAEMIGFTGSEALWAGGIFIFIGLLIDVVAVKSISDRKVLELKPVGGPTIILFLIATLLMIGGLLIILF